MTPPLPLGEAQARLLDRVTPLGVKTVRPADSLHRYLEQPVVATRTQPAADLSAMDGYALREGDSGPWRVVGESAAGHPFAGDVGFGQAVRISTGALMPTGTSAILLQENAEREGDAVRLNGQGEPTARHIRRKGFDFHSGDELLPAGTRMGAAQIALALAGGSAELGVHRLPRVVTIDTGDELATDPSSCTEHQIPASNGAMIAALARPFAGEIELLTALPDDRDRLVAAFAAAEKADVIVTSGGASVGDHDHLRPALEQWGATIDFWRVAIRPGKPLVVARKGDTWVLGLPGNPVSSYVTAFLFLLPLLRKLGGAAAALPRALPMTLARALPAVGDRTEFVRARLEGGTLVPLNEQDSSALVSLSRAQALIERPASAPAATAGDTVAAYWLENGGIA